MTNVRLRARIQPEADPLIGRPVDLYNSAVTVVPALQKKAPGFHLMDVPLDAPKLDGFLRTAGRGLAVPGPVAAEMGVCNHAIKRTGDIGALGPALSSCNLLLLNELRFSRPLIKRIRVRR